LGGAPFPGVFWPSGTRVGATRRPGGIFQVFWGGGGGGPVKRGGETVLQKILRRGAESAIFEGGQNFFLGPFAGGPGGVQPAPKGHPGGAKNPGQGREILRGGARAQGRPFVQPPSGRLLCIEGPKGGAPVKRGGIGTKRRNEKKPGPWLGPRFREAGWGQFLPPGRLTQARKGGGAGGDGGGGARGARRPGWGGRGFPGKGGRARGSRNLSGGGAAARGAHGPADGEKKGGAAIFSGTPRRGRFCPPPPVGGPQPVFGSHATGQRGKKQGGGFPLDREGGGGAFFKNGGGSSEPGGPPPIGAFVRAWGKKKKGGGAGAGATFFRNKRGRGGAGEKGPPQTAGGGKAGGGAI